MRAYDEGFGDPSMGERTWLLVTVMIGLLGSIACLSMTTFYDWGAWFFGTLGARAGIPLSIEVVIVIAVLALGYMSYRDDSWLRITSYASWPIFILAVYPISSLDWIHTFTGDAVVGTGSAPAWALFTLGVLLTATVITERCYQILDRTASMLETRGADVDEVREAMAGALWFDLRHIAMACSIASVAWIAVTLVNAVLGLSIAPVFGLLIAVGLLAAYVVMVAMDETVSV